MAITGSSINNFCMTVSGDSIGGLHFIRNVRVQFSAGAAGNSVLLQTSAGSTIYHAIADVANFSDGWAIMKQVKGIILAGVSGDAEVYVNVDKG